MPAAPSWLMPHRVSVERYEGDTAYGPTYAAPEGGLRAMVSEKRVQTRSPQGEITLSTAQLICPPGVDWPAGSKVTLPSGRVTRVLSVSPHTAPGLPVPECTEVMCE